MTCLHDPEHLDWRNCDVCADLWTARLAEGARLLGDMRVPWQRGRARHRWLPIASKPCPDELAIPEPDAFDAAMGAPTYPCHWCGSDEGCCCESAVEEREATRR